MENKLSGIIVTNLKRKEGINCDFEICLKNEKKSLFKSYYVHNLSNKNHKLWPLKIP